MRKRENNCLLFALPALLFLTFFLFVPIILAVVLSLTNYDGFSPSFKFVGFENYIRVLTSARFPRIFINTIYLVVLFVPLLNFFSIILAYMVTSIQKSIGTLYKSLIFYPNILSMIVIGFSFRMIMNTNNGVLNKLLNSIGIESINWLGDKNLVMISVTIALIWYSVGYYLIIYVAALMGIPNELYEAAEIEGCGEVKKFIYITVPMLSQAITINVILATMQVFVSFGIIFSLTEGGPGFASQTLPVEVYSYAFQRNDFPGGFATGVIIGVLALVIMLLEMKYFSKEDGAY